MLTFRAALPADAPTIVALVESGYRGDASRQGWTTEADLVGGRRTDAESVLQVIGSARGRILLVELDGDLAGCCQVEARGEGTAWFGMFSVRPALQGRGLGRAVMAEAERTARAEWSATEMRLLVICQREELIAWYERLGYRRTGELVPFAYDDPKVMAKRDGLELAVMTKPLA